RRHPPVAVADRFGFGEEIGLPPAIEPALSIGAASEEPPTLCSKFALELGDESDRRGCQHLVIAGLQRPTHDKVPGNIGGFGHSRHLPNCARASAVDDDRDHRPPTPKPPSSAPVAIPLDLFALLRLRSTGGELLSDLRPVSYDAAQHRSGQPAWQR